MSSPIKVPHTLVLLFGMVILAQIMTYVLPSGEFERQTAADGHHESVVAGSFHEVDAPALPWHAAFTSLPRGFEAAQGIIFFVFIVGGTFAVLRATGAIDAMIGVLLDKLSGVPWLLIAGGIVFFTAGSASIGMAEEYLPFIPVLIILCVGLGFDRITAVGILLVAYAVGYGCAPFNPFTVIIAQDIAGLETYSGTAYRVILVLLFMVPGFFHVYRYSRKVAADPGASLLAGLPDDGDDRLPDNHPTFVPAHGVVLALVVALIGLLVWGIKVHGWYLSEMMALFVGLAVVLGFVARLSPDTVAREFCVGAAELATTALLIGFARTIQVVLDEGRVVDTIINAVAAPLEGLGPSLAAVGMFMFQSVCNLFIPSGSGQAYVTVPLMAPLGDLVGVNRQIAVLAYQFGDGFTNILVPTNAVLVGILAIARVPLDRWWRFIMPFMVQLWVLGSLALVIAVWMDYK